MKDFVISVNNTVLYIALAFVWLIGLVSMFSASFLSGLAVLVGGTLTWCIISGFGSSSRPPTKSCASSTQRTDALKRPRLGPLCFGRINLSSL